MGDEIDVARLTTIVGVVAEPAARFRFSRIARPSVCDELLDAAVEMEAQLVVDFAR
jgi:hypothetical protein